MPNAEVNLEPGDPIDLRSLPGAYVRLQAVSFGTKLTRRDKATKMSMELAEKEGESGKVDVEFLNRWTRAYDFQHCIAEHNLEMKNGQPMDFSNPMTLDLLDPKVGTEIEKLIDELLGEDDDDLADFTGLSTSSSRDDSLHTEDT